jgi:hypothetical protein
MIASKTMIMSKTMIIAEAALALRIGRSTTYEWMKSMPIVRVHRTIRAASRLQGPELFPNRVRNALLAPKKSKATQVVGPFVPVHIERMRFFLGFLRSEDS